VGERQSKGQVGLIPIKKKRGFFLVKGNMVLEAESFSGRGRSDSLLSKDFS